MMKFFSRIIFFLGWSVFWRVWLVSLVAEISVFLIFLIPILAPRAADVGQIFSTILVFGVWIWACGWAGKDVLKKRSLQSPNRFLGWSIFWRAMVGTLFIAVPIGLALLFSGEFFLPNDILKTVTRVLALTVLVIITSYSYGWATLNASGNKPIDTELGKQLKK